MGEGCAYRGPKPQELVRLRKAIESGDKATVMGLVWANPRYLISSGDTPTILQVRKMNRRTGDGHWDFLLSVCTA